MPKVLPRIEDMAPYVPGRSIAEIRERFGHGRVIKMASNENPLGASPLAMEAVRRHAGDIFRYPQGGNPDLVRAIAERHNVPASMVAVGNGSDEIIDMLMRIMVQPPQDNIVCFEPCFGMYTTQARVNGMALRRLALNADFAPDLAALADLADARTKLVFITTPDNPSGFCPKAEHVLKFVERLALAAPAALAVIDEAYMDFSDDQAEHSLLAMRPLPQNAVFLRTFSKSFGLAGLRAGYAIMPERIAQCYWRARMPFSVNVLAEQAALAALEDVAFYEATLRTVREGRELLSGTLTDLGCKVWPSQANFLMFEPAPGTLSAMECFEKLLALGIIIRPLASYGLPDKLRVSIGNNEENRAFCQAFARILRAANHGQASDYH